jgi:hypothetical protein
MRLPGIRNLASISSWFVHLLLSDRSVPLLVDYVVAISKALRVMSGIRVHSWFQRSLLPVSATLELRSLSSTRCPSPDETEDRRRVQNFSELPRGWFR